MKNVRTINSRDNPRIKRLKKLAGSARERREEGLMLLDGVHLLEALLAVRIKPRELYVAESALAQASGEIAACLARPLLGATPLYVLPDSLLRDVAPTETPTGLLAVAELPALPEQTDPQADAVLLDGVQDPGNLGTLIRTAAAAGFRQIVLSSGCADPWSPKALRAAQGGQFRATLFEGQDLCAFLKGYRGTPMVTRLDGATSLYAMADTPFQGPVAWVFGAEGRGVSPAVMAAVPTGVLIPLPGRVESLNVAAAAAVCLFDTLRRRGVK
ncbi:RNA methyltransferase [Oryzomicrobium sp.]|uniref:TrmH family RNA methyltransferase n=1 Tax=Oryzomicrobium sp. TaxID=1911578 RepID=UPI0025F2AC5D|nr:RNA methyltransferase [Oryzomicrobium sp.]MCE1242796.1 RNA methyltransferase [Oryzomicrobium sp.]